MILGKTLLPVFLKHGAFSITFKTKASGPVIKLLKCLFCKINMICKDVYMSLGYWDKDKKYKASMQYILY